VGSQTTESELRELLKEAADSAKDDYGPEAAIEWANGYTFPLEYVKNDIRCLEEAQRDFQAIVRKRLAELTPGRMNADRIAMLRSDNPERALLAELAGGIYRRDSGRTVLCRGPTGGPYTRR
jgi:hypothetical protein